MLLEATVKDEHAEIAITFGAGILRERADAADRDLEELYDSYAASLFRYALALTGSSDDAEDAVQEIFARLARGRRRLAKIDNVRAYLFSATRNAANGILRSKRRRSILQDEVCADFRTHSAHRNGDSVTESLVLCQALAELPVEQREVLVLKVFDGMTFKEIASTTGASINTVASRYRYGIDKLREAIEAKDDG